MVEHTIMKEGMITARMLIGKDAFQSAVRVINLSDERCRIKEGVCVAVAQQACDCRSEQSPGSLCSIISRRDVAGWSPGECPDWACGAGPGGQLRAGIHFRPTWLPVTAVRRACRPNLLL